MKQVKRKIVRNKVACGLMILLFLSILQSLSLVSIQAKSIDSVRIQSKTAYREVKSKDGTVVLKCSLMYPQIMGEKENAGDRSLKEVNSQIEVEAMLRLQDRCKEATEYVNEFIGEIFQGDLPHSWLPFAVDINYEITYNKKGILSFTYTIFEWLGGAHPQTTLAGFIYDITDGKQKNATDFLQLSEKEIKQAVADEMAKLYKQNPTIYFKEEVEALQKLEFEPEYYLSEEGIVFFFQAYEVAPYVTGIVRAPLKYIDYPSIYIQSELFTSSNQVNAYDARNDKYKSILSNLSHDEQVESL